MMRLIEDYIRTLLHQKKINEVIVDVAGTQYDVSDAEAEIVDKFIQTEPPQGLGKVKHDPEGLWIDMLSEMDPEIAYSLSTVITSYIPKDFREIVKVKLSEGENEHKKIEGSLWSFNPVGTVQVPDVFKSIANYRTAKSSGTQIGRGELVIPLMFRGARINMESNALYDVTVGNIPWHVKEASPTAGIKMGSARDKLVTNSSIFKRLVRMGVDPSTFNDLGVKALGGRLAEWTDLLGYDSPKAFLDAFTNEALEIAIGDGGGIIWFNKGNLIFSKKEELHLHGLTQGRFKLSTTPYKALQHMPKQSSTSPKSLPREPGVAEQGDL